MKKKEEKAMVPATKQEMVPAYLQGGEGRGKENVDKSDLILPRLKLLQPLSPEVQDEEKKGVQGHMINTLTRQDYGSSIIFTPIVHFKSRILWRGRDDEASDRILCSAADGLHPTTEEYAKLCTQCKEQQWNNDEVDKAPRCTIFYNFVVIIDGEITPIALSMEKTKIKTAKKLLSLITHTGNLDMFAKKYKIGITKEQNKKGIWYNYDITPVGFVSAEEFKVAEAAYQSLKNLAVSVDHEVKTDE